MDKPQSLCVLRLSALGDCINAFGLIGGMKRTYPDLDITWVLDQRFAPLFCDEQGHDLVPMINLNCRQGILGARKTLKQAIKSQGLHFDALLNLQTSIKASLCSTVIPATTKYGYDAERSREGQSLFVDKKVPSPDNPHVLAGFMAFAEECGYPIAEPVWDFKLDPYVIDKARCVVSHEKVCAICPCSASKAKNWTIEGYVELARHAQEQDMCVVLMGGKDQLEIDTCAAIENQCTETGPVINLCGKTNLRELAAYLSIAKIVVAPDSGSMHLASAVGAPVIGLFAIHDDQRVGPWNFMDLNVCVYHKIASQELKGKSIPWRYRVRTKDAMEHITPDQVISAFDKALERYRI